MSDKVTLRIEDALEVKIKPYYGKSCTQYKYLCTDCSKELWYRKSEVLRVGGKCRSCAGRDSVIKNFKGKSNKHRKREYERIYNNFTRLTNKEVKISFEEFKELCKNDICHYCYTKVYRSKFGNEKSMGYYLDRKDNNIGYTLENVVTCCTRCNYAKSNKYSYEEWYGMTKFFRDKKEILYETKCN